MEASHMQQKFFSPSANNNTVIFSGPLGINMYFKDIGLIYTGLI
jgi:hypothetical protein